MGAGQESQGERYGRDWTTSESEVTTSESEVRKDGIGVPFMDGVPLSLLAELLDGIDVEWATVRLLAVSTRKGWDRVR